MLTKNDLKQIEKLFDNQEKKFDDKLDRTKTEILIETRVIVRNEIFLALKPIENRLEKLEEKVDKLFEMENEDTKALGLDIQKMKKKIKELEDKFKQYKLVNSKK